MKVFFGFDPEAIRSIDIWFDHVYEPEWFDDERVKQIVKDIDKSEVISRDVVISPILGSIPVSKISGGSKALIAMLMMDDTLIDLIVCGPNCQKWLSHIFAEKDIEVTMSGYDLEFRNFQISGICLNNNSVINNYEDWINDMINFVDEGNR